MRTIATVLAMLAVALGAVAFAQETTIEVPQGSGVFPTVGQVNCLEELGSGRYCAATYGCSGGVSGELWGDMGNHDGRRAISADSPVARQRNCVVTVDGKAAVRWLTGYSPGGRTGDIVGLTPSADALRPVQRVVRSAGEDGRPLLAYILERHNTTLSAIVDLVCERATGRDGYCEEYELRRMFGGVDGRNPDDPDWPHNRGTLFGGQAGFADLKVDSVTQCLVELYETPAFCDAHTGARFFDDLGNPVSCDYDSRMMPYHLVKWPNLYWTFAALGPADFQRFGTTRFEVDLNELIRSEQGQQCADAAIDKLQQQHGVEIIEYVRRYGVGILTISD